MSGLPQVKVIVPCYGYGHHLEGCLESVLGQEGVEVKALVIDDCSPDDTAAVASAIARRDERVELRRHAQNLGLIAGANEGLRWAEDADYVVLLSADDLLAPGSLGRAATVMSSRPEVGMVYGRAPYFHSSDELPDAGGRWRGAKVWPGREWIRRRYRTARNCVCSPEVVVRASVQREVGGYDPAHPYMSDLHMWLRIAAVADVAYLRGPAQAFYRAHPESMSRSMALGEAGAVRDLAVRQAVFEDFLDGPRVAPEEAARLRSQLRRRLAREALQRAGQAYEQASAGSWDEGLVDQLVAFARESFPRIESLPEWRGLRLRRWLGPGRSGRFPPFLAARGARRLRGHVAWRRRLRLGV